MSTKKKAVLKLFAAIVINGPDEFQLFAGVANIPVLENPGRIIAEAQDMVAWMDGVRQLRHVEL